MPHTLRLHRVLRCPPERLFRALLDPLALAKWLPPQGFVCEVLAHAPVVGGRFRMRFINFTTGASHGFGGHYLEILPNERLRYTDVFDDPNLSGEMQVTMTLRAVTAGTDLSITQEGVPDAIPADGCYVGWQQSLRQLADLVEPEIP